jgi:hypothetical protein
LFESNTSFSGKKNLSIVYKELVFDATKTFLYYTRGKEDGLLHHSPIPPINGMPDFKVSMNAKFVKRKEKAKVLKMKKKKCGPPDRWREW